MKTLKLFLTSLIILSSSFVSLEQQIENSIASDVQEWGVINKDSKQIYNMKYSYATQSTSKHIPEIVVNLAVPRIIHGIRLNKLNNTGAIGTILVGGLGFNYLSLKITSSMPGESFHTLLELYQNNSDVPISEVIVKEWGVINKNSKNFRGSSYTNYAFPGSFANGTEIENVSTTIDGMRLISYNDQNGLWELKKGGVGFNFVEFEFASNGSGKGYEFKIQFFKN